ncbi:MAG: hypothetical protein JWO93_57 [Micrococcaceae bacterium]|nr:hypothetical protein [Micrococcaceae bacterium]
MAPTTERTLHVAGRAWSDAEALQRLRAYPFVTLVLFDFSDRGRPCELSAAEVMSTRYIGSGLSPEFARFVIDAAATAPWLAPDSDLAEAEPQEDGLFAAMEAPYRHFDDRAPRGLGMGKISKVLHLKLPGLYPMLDTHLMRAHSATINSLSGTYQELDRRQAAWVAVRDELRLARSSGALDELRTLIRGFESDDQQEQQRVRTMDNLTDLRLLDILSR